MTKCDFCTESSADGKCFWSSAVCREDYCKKAIERMVKALGGEPEKNKRIKRFWED